MSDATLRTTERDLYAAAEELRAEADDLRDAKAELEDRLRREYDTVADVPTEDAQDHQQYVDAIRETVGTARTFEHYADAWSSDGETCVFILQELSGGAYAKVVDAVSAEAAKQAREDGAIPQGFGHVKALEFGVADKPEGAPANPGRWPAAITQDLFEQLNQITAPSGVDLGNESLGAVFGNGTAPPTDTTTTPSGSSATAPASPSPTPPDG